MIIKKKYPHQNGELRAMHLDAVGVAKALVVSNVGFVMTVRWLKNFSLAFMLGVMEGKKEEG